MEPNKQPFLDEELEIFLNKKKGNICSELEKVCPTDRSFERTKKTAHDVFQDIRDYVLANYSKKDK